MATDHAHSDRDMRDSVKTTPRSQFPSLTLWRLALLALAIVLGLTNLIELAASFRPDYWDRVGQVQFSGQPEHGKLRVLSSNQVGNRGILGAARGRAAELSTIETGDLVSVVPVAGAPGPVKFAPSVLEFFRFRDRLEPITLRVEHGAQSQIIVAGHGAPAPLANQLAYYSQVGIDLIFAIVGGLLAWRRPEDKAVRALAIAMICWSSNIPSASDSPVFDVLFLINQLTARVWVEILLVYWAIHLSPTSRWGISTHLKRLWPLWATLTIALGFTYRYAMYYAFPLRVDTLRTVVDYNQTILFIAPLLALTEGMFSTQGETRTRIRWGLFVFGLYFSIFPYRIYIQPRLDLYWPNELFQITVDSLLQLVLPVGLLYATLRHRLLDLSFAINRGLVYGMISAIVLATFFGLEKLSESVLQFQGREQNALLAGCIAFGIFLFFHKVRDWVERNVERFFFSAWHRKESALREYVRSAAHISKVDALIASCITALDRFNDYAGCAIYRRDWAGNYPCLRSSMSAAPAEIDGDDPLVLAMRVARGVVRCADVGSSLSQEMAFPVLYRGEVDGFMLLNRKASQEAYRPDEIELLGFSIQQIGLDLTALEREQYKQRASELEALASTARSSAEEMRGLLQLALGRQGIVSPNPALTAPDGDGP